MQIFAEGVFIPSAMIQIVEIKGEEAVYPLEAADEGSTYVVISELFVWKISAIVHIYQLRDNSHISTNRPNFI